MNGPLRLLTVAGARPQFIKAAALHRAVACKGGEQVHEMLLHTGQHYDDTMSKVFFDELGLPVPAIHLGVGPGKPAEQFARMTEGIARAIEEVHPDVVVVYGDTTSTLAGAMAAATTRVPLAHVEAGLRSYDRTMPEETNRVLTDHCSTWLFCPTTTAVENLRREGFAIGPVDAPSASRPAVVLAGDIMLDNALHFADTAARRSRILEELGVARGAYLLLTLHRPRNVDNPQRLGTILRCMSELQARHGMPVVFPVHPRTRARIGELHGNKPGTDILAVPPVGFLDMIALLGGARVVLTDSGGLQKEAAFLRKACVVLRDVTEWTELVEHGHAVLADADPLHIAAAVDRWLDAPPPPEPSFYGDGRAATRMLEELLQWKARQGNAPTGPHGHD
jgi:UDP-GlcNAc3NAcA epimerase